MPRTTTSSEAVGEKKRGFSALLVLGSVLTPFVTQQQQPLQSALILTNKAFTDPAFDFPVVRSKLVKLMVYRGVSPANAEATAKALVLRAKNPTYKQTHTFDPAHFAELSENARLLYKVRAAFRGSRTAFLEMCEVEKGGSLASLDDEPRRLRLLCHNLERDPARNMFVKAFREELLVPTAMPKTKPHRVFRRLMLWNAHRMTLRAGCAVGADKSKLQLNSSIARRLLLQSYDRTHWQGPALSLWDDVVTVSSHDIGRK